MDTKTIEMISDEAKRQSAQFIALLVAYIDARVEEKVKMTLAAAQSKPEESR